MKKIIVAILSIVSLVIVFQLGQHQGTTGQTNMSAKAAESDSGDTGWSPTKPYPKHNVYYPGTEELKPDEMRVIALGSGMPMPRRKQAAASFLIELGNGDKFIFDMGTGSMERLYAFGIPLDFINKVFLTHLHADHMGDLPGFYIYGPQNNRSVPCFDAGIINRGSEEREKVVNVDKVRLLFVNFKR